MADGYQTFELTWQERTITASYQPNWLNGHYCHIELRCTERLPVTETGYRSHFIHLADEVDAETIKAYITAWLDSAADTKAWRQYLENSRQLTLF